jgi:hypothetical protein
MRADQWVGCSRGLMLDGRWVGAIIAALPQGSRVRLYRRREAARRRLAMVALPA